MSTSELVAEHHLSRTAIIYIRQSSPHQVLTNQESLRLQYALRQRAQALGWHPEAIEIIDTDLGLSGAEVQHREGFKELLARLSLGPGRDYPVLRGYPSVTQLLRLVSVAGSMRLQGVFDCRLRWGL